MTLAEIKQWLTEHKDDTDAIAYLSELKGSAGTITKGDVEKFLATDEGKGLLKSEVDRMVQKGIETFKTKTMPGLIKEAVDAKIKELNPEETSDQKRIREQDERIANLEGTNKKERLSKVVLRTLSSKSLSELSELGDLLIGDDEDATLVNIGNLETALNIIVEARILKEFPGRKPKNKETEEKEDPNFKNPWLPKYLDLTKQGEIWVKDEKRARRLRAEAEDAK